MAFVVSLFELTVGKQYKKNLHSKWNNPAILRFTEKIIFSSGSFTD